MLRKSELPCLILSLVYDDVHESMEFDELLDTL